MRVLFFLFFAPLYFSSCDSSTKTIPASADSKAVMKEIDKELKLKREEYYLKIKDKRSIELKFNTNEHSKDSHGKEILVHIKLNNLEFVETTWGKYVTEPIHLKLELTDTVLERVYGVIEQMELNHSIFEKFKNSGNVMYNASLKIDNKLVINLKGGRDLMNNQVASNLMLLADHLRNLANGDEDEFMQWSGKIMDDTNQEKL